MAMARTGAKYGTSNSAQSGSTEFISMSKYSKPPVGDVNASPSATMAPLFSSWSSSCGGDRVQRRTRGSSVGQNTGITTKERVQCGEARTPPMPLLVKISFFSAVLVRRAAEMADKPRDPRWLPSKSRTFNADAGNDSSCCSGLPPLWSMLQNERYSDCRVQRPAPGSASVRHCAARFGCLSRKAGAWTAPGTHR